MKKFFLPNHPIGPNNNAVNVSVNKKEIARGFNQKIHLGNHGSVRLRSGSQKGEIIEEFSFDSDRVFVSARDLIVVPTNPLPYNTKIYLTMDDGFVIATKTGEECKFLNEDSSITFSFTTEPEPVVEKKVIKVGDYISGGTVVSVIGGRYLIVSPDDTEQNVSWDDIKSVESRALEVTKSKGWFIPTKEQLINPELIPFEYLNTAKKTVFWSSDSNGSDAYAVDVSTRQILSINKKNNLRTRTFKFVED